MKPQVLYGLILAVIYVQNAEAVKLDQRHVQIEPGRLLANRDEYVSNLSILAESLNDPSTADEGVREFIAATSRTTNEINRRSIVFKWLYNALTLKHFP